MSNTVQGLNTPLVPPAVLNHAMGIAQAMSQQGGTAAAWLSGDQYAAASGQRGSAPGTTSLLDPPAAQQQPPELFVNANNQLVTADGQPYLGRNLFLAEDAQGNPVVVDENNQPVELEALERQHGIGAPAQTPEKPELFTAENGQIVTADGQPYLGQELYLAQDEFGNQVVVDANNQIVDLDALEAAAARGELQPTAPTQPAQQGQQPAPPQFYLGANNQIVDASGQPYLGMEMFLRDDGQGNPLVVDAQGNQLDFDAVIARAGYDPNLEPVAASDPGADPYAPAPGQPQTVANGPVNPGGYARNTAALLLDLWRNRGTPAAAPPPAASGAATVQAQANATTAANAQANAANTATAQATATGRRTLLRDARGRFVSPKTVPQGNPPEAGARQVPVRARDARGRFVSTKPPAGTPPEAGTRSVPLRDARGRFVSPKRTQARVEMRDAQGRFLKPHSSVTASINPPHGPGPNPGTTAATGSTATTGTTAATPAAGTRQLPLRDARGRFVSRNSAPQATTTPTPGTRQLPLRDARGRFVSRNAATTGTASATGTTATTATTSAPRALPPRDARGRFVSASTQGTTQAGAGSSHASQPAGTTPRVGLGGRLLPAALLANDAYNLYQGINHWDDPGNNSKFDDALRIGGSAVSAVASANALRTGNLRAGVAMHVTGLAANTLGTILNDQD